MIETAITASCRNGYEVRVLVNACNPASRRQEDAGEFDATLGYIVNSRQAGENSILSQTKAGLESVYSSIKRT